MKINQTELIHNVFSDEKFLNYGTSMLLHTYVNKIISRVHNREKKVSLL